MAELKARTAKQIERARTQILDLKELRDNIEAGKTFPIFGDTIYKADAETMNGILKYAAAGATACRMQDELEARTRNAEAKAEQADRQRAEAERELTWTREGLKHLQTETQVYTDIPEHLKGWTADKIEGWRTNYRDRTDEINRAICKMFLDNNRDFLATVKQSEPLLNKMRIPKEQHKAYIKGCLSAVMKQARTINRAEKKGGGWTPPSRGRGWQPKPSETNFFAHLLPDLSNVGIPVSANQFSHKDWDDLTEDEKERILFLMQM